MDGNFKEEVTDFKGMNVKPKEDHMKTDIEIIKYNPGDGKVLATSALMDTRVGGTWVPQLQSPIHWSSVTFLFAAHMGITQDPVFVVNVLYTLLAT